MTPWGSEAFAAANLHVLSKYNVLYIKFGCMSPSDKSPGKEYQQGWISNK